MSSFAGYLSIPIDSLTLVCAKCDVMCSSALRQCWYANASLSLFVRSPFASLRGYESCMRAATFSLSLSLFSSACLPVCLSVCLCDSTHTECAENLYAQSKHSLFGLLDSPIRFALFLRDSTHKRALKRGQQHLGAFNQRTN